MKNICVAILLVVIAFASCAQKQSNKDTNERGGDTLAQQKPKETWGDFQMRKDSLWTVFNESTDEAEVDKARAMLYDMGCNAEWGMIVSTDYERRKARVEKEFQQFVSAHPEQETLFREEKERWENYHEAVLAVAELEDHGSSGTLYIIGTLEQSLDLWMASFHNMWLTEQNQDISFPKTIITFRMINNAYAAYIQQEDNDWCNIFSDDEKNGMEEHHKAIELEWQLWNEWMAFRQSASKSMPKDMRIIYDGCTNLTKRTKLHQLKNQNKGLGVISDDTDRCLLSDSCSDKELLEYPGFSVVMEQYASEVFNAAKK